MDRALGVLHSLLYIVTIYSLIQWTLINPTHTECSVLCKCKIIMSKFMLIKLNHKINVNEYKIFGSCLFLTNLNSMLEWFIWIKPALVTSYLVHTDYKFHLQVVVPVSFLLKFHIKTGHFDKTIIVLSY